MEERERGGTAGRDWNVKKFRDFLGELFDKNEVNLQIFVFSGGVLGRG